MSVYTSVSQHQLELFLEQYSIGKLRSHQGIAAGITNSNYWLETDCGSYVLTLFEHQDRRNLDYILGLQHHLSQQKIACAAPIKNNQGDFYAPLNHKSAAIIKRLQGEVCSQPTALHCALMGAELARLHLAGSGFADRHDNPCGGEWRLSIQKQLSQNLKLSDNQLLDEEIGAYHLLDRLDMPRGAVHADLFHDNALFRDASLIGIIDFEYACHDFWLYDLAIALNDWCIIENGEFEPSKLHSFIDAYDQIRPLQDIERETLPLMLRVAAMRFWLSRLYDRINPLPGELTYIKDSDVYRDILLLRREQGTI